MNTMITIALLLYVAGFLYTLAYLTHCTLNDDRIQSADQITVSMRLGLFLIALMWPKIFISAIYETYREG